MFYTTAGDYKYQKGTSALDTGVCTSALYLFKRSDKPFMTEPK